MPYATLATIRAAVLARLATLLASDPAAPTTDQPFAQVGAWQGEGGSREIDLDALASVPACLLAFERETYAHEVETVTGVQSLVGTSSWLVFLVTHDTRGVTEAAADTASDHPTNLIGAVAAALAGMVIDGLYRTQQLRLAEARVAYAKNGALVHVVRCTAPRPIDPAITDDALPALHIDAGVDLIDPVEGDVAPLVDFSVDL